MKGKNTSPSVVPTPRPNFFEISIISFCIVTIFTISEDKDKSPLSIKIPSEILIISSRAFSLMTETIWIPTHKYILRWKQVD